MNKIPRVIIIGAGFGGLAAAKALKNAAVEVVLFDRSNHHLFQPLLYQVATGALSPHDIAHPIRHALKDQANTQVLRDEATAIDLERRVVITHDGVEPYDYLIMATGVKTAYRGKDEWRPHALGLKTLKDALEIRERILISFEQAEREEDPVKQRALLTHVVCGGGPTGVELAGSLAELARFLGKDFRRIDSTSTRIILLQGSGLILNMFPEELSRSATRQLQSLGVEIRTGQRVTNITADGVQFGDQFIESRMVLWCTGVEATRLTATLGVPLDDMKRVKVEPDLSLPGHPEVFVVGDAATLMGQDGKPLPGLAPVATQGGLAAAASIIATINGKARKVFRYKHRGSLATIGRSAAIADFGAIKMSGQPAWLAWLFIHVMFLIGFRSKFAVIFTWFWSFVTRGRGMCLITSHRRTHAGAQSKEEILAAEAAAGHLVETSTALPMAASLI